MGFPFFQGIWVAGREVNASMRQELRKKLWVAELGEVSQEQEGEYACEVRFSSWILCYRDPGDKPFWGKEQGEGSSGSSQFQLPMRFAPEDGGGVCPHHAQCQLQGVCRLQNASIEL